MKQIVKRILVILLIVTLALPLCACNKKKDDEKISMYIGLGNTNGTYYAELHQAILDNTGIDVNFVFSRTNDTTSAIATRIKNYDLPADIVITAMKTDAEDQKNAFLDLAKDTNLLDLFKTQVINEVSINGAVYQLPYTTRLIGITYNKTLFNEMGWDLPENFNDMVELKAKTDAAGIRFAVSGGAATGHGFNYLFHLIGTNYLIGSAGTKWLSDFQAGDVDVATFAQEANYFKKYAEAGLFGDIHVNDWLASTEFCKTRALFYYNILNDCYSYDGPMYDANGQEIEGVILHDEYGTMPWISEDGSSNCFTVYNSMYVALDKKLGEKEESEKLQKAIKVLEFMASDEASKIFTKTFPDGYVSTNNFNIDESRLYYEYKDSINKGFLQPWYYNDFDTDTIVNVGEKVNKYLAGIDGVSFDDIMSELQYQNDLTLQGKADEAIEITGEFGYEDCAKLQAKLGAIALGKKNVMVNVSLIPYTDAIDKLPLQKALGVVQEKLYKGLFKRSESRRVITSQAQNFVAVKMTGAEIKAFVKEGYDISEDYEAAKEGCTVFPYVMVVRSSMAIEDGKEYLVSIPKSSMPVSTYERFVSEGKLVLGENGEPIIGDTEDGLDYLFENYKTLGPSDFLW